MIMFMMNILLNEDAHEALMEMFDTRSTFQRDHDNDTQWACQNGTINNKGAAIAKARPYVENGLSAVIIGAPRYSDRDAVMGYDWSLVFVGPNEDARNFGYEDSDCQIKVITKDNIDNKKATPPSGWVGRVW
jgi:hypothetical protein